MRPTLVSTGKSLRCSDSSMIQATLLRPRPTPHSCAIVSRVVASEWLHLKACACPASFVCNVRSLLHVMLHHEIVWYFGTSFTSTPGVLPNLMMCFCSQTRACKATSNACQQSHAEAQMCLACGGTWFRATVPTWLSVVRQDTRAGQETCLQGRRHVCIDQLMACAVEVYMWNAALQCSASLALSCRGRCSGSVLILTHFWKQLFSRAPCAQLPCQKADNLSVPRQDESRCRLLNQTRGCCVAPSALLLQQDVPDISPAIFIRYVLTTSSLRPRCSSQSRLMLGGFLTGRPGSDLMRSASSGLAGPA